MFDGKKLEKCRKSKNISRLELANRIGMPIRTLESWDWGVCKTTDKVRMQQIADVLECRLIDLYDFTEIDADTAVISALELAIEWVPIEEIIVSLNNLTNKYKKADV